MNPLKQRNFDPDTIEGEFNLVEMWNTFRAERIRAGFFAGIFASVMMLIFGMIYCAATGRDILAPMKIAALPFMGGAAMTYGMGPGLALGTVVFFILMIFLAIVYAHFTGVNDRKGLLGMGVTWGAFGWVFITNLMAPSFRGYLTADIPRGVMFFAWMVYGVSLCSVAWFDKVGYKETRKTRVYGKD